MTVRICTNKNYVSTHLGNVLVTISDRRTAICNEVDSTLSYKVVVVTATDYYSFGSPMIGRTYEGDTSLKYRYGFNGKEMDDESSLQDYGMRIYNGRLGKFLSVDPITKQFPELSTYQFASNRPIDGIDLDGLEYLSANESRVEFKNGKLELKVENFLKINKNAFWNANQNPSNWSTDPNTGERMIGIDQTILQINFLFDPKLPEAIDVVDMPESTKGDSEKGAKKPKKTNEKNNNKKTENYKPKTAVQKRMQAVISLVVESYRHLLI